MEARQANATMTEVEARPPTLKERMAALQLNQVGVTLDQTVNTGRPASKYGSHQLPAPTPRLPTRPELPARHATSNNPPLRDHPTIYGEGTGNQPARPPIIGASANGMDGISRPALPPRTSSGGRPSLPSRTSTAQVSPALPPRRPSAPGSNGSAASSSMHLTRRESRESISSNGTNFSAMSSRSNGTSLTSQSNGYEIKAPAFDPSALPSLPPKRTQEEKDAQARKDREAAARKSSGSFVSGILGKTKTPALPSRPVTRPAAGRNSTPAVLVTNGAIATNETTVTNRRESGGSMPAPLPVTRQLVPPPPRKSALEMGFGTSTTSTSTLPGLRSNSTSATNGAPPPVPASSKPDLAALQSSKPKPAASTPSSGGKAEVPGSCLHCRDFSGPDNHAARFPRQSIPSNDIGWLAQQLTSQFPSATDKARAIFTWLHHNIAYDVVAFFGNNVQSSTPQSTIATGLAVCEGYAGLFSALALKAGLECVVVSGASKGFGHTQLKPGDALPAFASTHAWNACRIDGGVWKLIDPCWGAGNVEAAGPKYNKSFSPNRFTQSNDEFGTDHYPSDDSKQFRNDGRILPWEEYVRGSRGGSAAGVCMNTAPKEGLDQASFTPRENPIPVSLIPGPTVRFLFQKICPHWDPIRNGLGAPYLFVFQSEAAKDDKEWNCKPLAHAKGVWWLDVPVRFLGSPGAMIKVYAVTEFRGKDGRGLSAKDWVGRHGTAWGCQFQSVGTWEVGR